MDWYGIGGGNVTWEGDRGLCLVRQFSAWEGFCAAFRGGGSHGRGCECGSVHGDDFGAGEQGSAVAAAEVKESAVMVAH